MIPVVVGLDLSLTATGAAHPHPDGGAMSRTLKAGARRGMTRLAWLRDEIHTITTGADLVTIEGYSFSSRASQAHALGELGGVIRLALHEAGTPHLDVPPATLKTYATGRGNAGKVDVVVAARERLGYQGTDDNEADALWLRAIGLDLLGHPIVALPKTHRRALDKLTRPGDAAA